LCSWFERLNAGTGSWRIIGDASDGRIRSLTASEKTGRRFA
jgi:hypothetical protein